MGLEIIWATMRKTENKILFKTDEGADRFQGSSWVTSSRPVCSLNPKRAIAPCILDTATLVATGLFGIDHEDF